GGRGMSAGRQGELGYRIEVERLDEEVAVVHVGRLIRKGQRVEDAARIGRVHAVLEGETVRVDVIGGKPEGVERSEAREGCPGTERVCPLPRAHEHRYRDDGDANDRSEPRTRPHLLHLSDARLRILWLAFAVLTSTAPAKGRRAPRPHHTPFPRRRLCKRRRE